MKIAVLVLALFLLPAFAAAQNDAPAPAAAAPAPVPAVGARVANRYPNRVVARPARPASMDTFEGRLVDMQNTLRQMHALLEDMQNRLRPNQPAPKSASAKSAAAKSAPADDFILADNLRMWQLLLNHLDATMAQARLSAMRHSVSQRLMNPPDAAAPAPPPVAQP
jgi:pyruvate/2-oxoglutarate dehydrogenase complex dihydrolipoamide acyltransferase (E2) component